MMERNYGSCYSFRFSGTFWIKKITRASREKSTSMKTDMTIRETLLLTPIGIPRFALIGRYALILFSRFPQFSERPVR